MAIEKKKELDIQKQIDALEQQLRQWQQMTTSQRSTVKRRGANQYIQSNVQADPVKRKAVQDLQKALKTIGIQRAQLSRRFANGSINHQQYMKERELLRQQSKQAWNQSRKARGDTEKLLKQAFQKYRETDAERRYRRLMPKLRQQLAAQRAKMAPLRQQIQRQQLIVNRIQNQIAKLKTKIKHCDKKCGGIKVNLERIEEELKKKQEDLKKSDQELKKLQKRLGLSVAVRLSEEVIDEQKKKLQKVLSGFEGQQQEITTQTAALEEREREFEEQLLEKMAQVDQIEQERDMLITQKKRLEYAQQWQDKSSAERQETAQAMLDQTVELNQLMDTMEQERNRKFEEELRIPTEVSELPPEVADDPEALHRVELDWDILDFALSGWYDLYEEVETEEASIAEEWTLLTDLDTEMERLPQIEADISQLNAEITQLYEDIEKLEAEIITVEDELGIVEFGALWVEERIFDATLSLELIEAGVMLFEPSEFDVPESEVEGFESREAAKTDRGFGAFVEGNVRATTFRDQQGFMAGGRVALIRNHKFSIGIGGYALVSDFEVPAETFEQPPPFEETPFGEIPYEETPFVENHYLDMGYGGLVLEYMIAPMTSRSRFYLSANVLLGVGGVKYRSDKFDLSKINLDDSDEFLIAEPGLSLSLNFSKHSQLALGANYRFARGVDLTGINDDDLTEPSVTLSFRLGWF